MSRPPKLLTEISCGSLYFESEFFTELNEKKQHFPLFQKQGKNLYSFKIFFVCEYILLALPPELHYIES